MVTSLVLRWLQQLRCAAAAGAAANEVMRVPESLLTSAAVALKCLMYKKAQHAAAAEAAANEGMCVSESLLTSAAVALKYLMIKKAQQAAAATAAASFVKCNVTVVVSHMFAFHWTLLGIVFCNWVGIPMISFSIGIHFWNLECWIWKAFGSLTCFWKRSMVSFRKVEETKRP